MTEYNVNVFLGTFVIEAEGELPKEGFMQNLHITSDI